MTTKTLFDAVEGELKNARVAISNADRYLDAVKEAVETMEAKVKIIEEVGIEPLVKASAKEEEEEEEDVLKALRPGSLGNIIVKTERGEYGIPIAVDSEDESLVYMLKLRDVIKGARPDFGVDIKRVEETINGIEIITLVNGVKIATGKENKAVGEYLKLST